MDTWEWTKIAAAVSAAATVAVVSGWLGSRMVETTYTAAPVIEVPDLEEAPVDLASLQRSWPVGLSERGEHGRLRGYMAGVKRGAVPLPPPTAAASAAAPAAPVDLGTLLASADPKRGQDMARVCASCHTFDQGGADRTGPNLWAVVGRDIAAHRAFAYSKAMSAQPGNWTYEELDRYLTSPSRAIPGNKMAFAGIRRPADRANVLAYLGSLGSTPAPYPQPVTAAAGNGGQGPAR